MLSPRQRLAARRAAESQLGALATVTRHGETETATGTHTVPLVVYSGIRCQIGNVTGTTPGVQNVQGFGPDQKEFFGVGFFPLTHETMPGVAEPVVILQGDTVECDGIRWRATYDMDHPQPGSRRVRVRLSRPHSGVLP